jgi:hypothetical protein
LVAVSPTAVPAYGPDATSVGIRHLAAQFGEDPLDVLELARQGELRSLFVRGDQQVSATPTVEPGHRVPTPLEVAQRSHVEPQGNTDGGADPAVYLSLLAEREKGLVPDGLDPHVCLVELAARRSEQLGTGRPDRLSGEEAIRILERRTVWPVRSHNQWSPRGD